MGRPFSWSFNRFNFSFWFKENGPPKQVYQYEIDELLEEQERAYSYDYKEKEELSVIWKITF